VSCAAIDGGGARDAEIRERLAWIAELLGCPSVKCTTGRRKAELGYCEMNIRVLTSLKIMTCQYHSAKAGYRKERDIHCLKRLNDWRQ
jgi:hypothetical protein